MNQLGEHFRVLRKISGQRRGRGKLFLQIFAVLVTLICLYLAFRGINWKDFLNIFLTGNYALLPIVLILSTIIYFIRALRWRVLLKSEPKMDPLKVFWANMVGYLGNNIFPARAGEVIRAFYLGNEYGISTSYVFATCMVERIGDVFALIFIGSASLLAMHLFSGGLLSAIVFFLVIGVFGLVFMAFLPKIKGPIFNWLRRFTLYRKIQAPVENFIDNLSSGFEILREKRIIFYFLLYTGLIWFLDALTTILAASIFHLPLSLFVAFVLLAALGLSSAIPSTPGYIGVYQFVAVLVLVPLGYSHETAIAFITATQIIGFLLIVFWGFIGVLFFPAKKSITN
jgi:uncharacterized protein (TIRG00374 family)